MTVSTTRPFTIDAASECDEHFRFCIERQRLILERSVPFRAVDRERATFRKRVDHKPSVVSRVNATADQLAVLSPGVKDPHPGSEPTLPQRHASVDAVPRLESDVQASGSTGRAGVKRNLPRRKALRRHPQFVTPEDVVDVIELAFAAIVGLCRTFSKSCSCPGSPIGRCQRACHRAP